MSKKVKKLLEESTIRKFMKYANIEPLAETFLDSVEEEEELDEMGDEMSYAREEDELDMEAGEAELEVADEEPDMDMGGDVDEDMVRQIVAAVADAISDVTGVDVGVEDEADEGPEMEMGEEPEEDMPEEEPVEMAEAEESSEETVEEAKEEDDEEMKEEFDYDSVVSEVARRVALRLVKETKK